MPYLGLHHLLPDLASRETRTVTVFRAGGSLPPDEYLLIEMFCDEAGCDCRRVMLQVMSVGAGRVEAVIAYGWEDVEFYRRWNHDDDDPMIIRHLKGPVLNLGSPETENSEAAFAMVQEVALSDPLYVERLKRHYAAFREKIEANARSAKAKKVGRNDRCPCGSGRKWKVCCGQAGAAEGVALP
ncbi:MAG: SEC-C domain-containing protein [Planctomycetes bacterium]|nr:SEC-C domain-containing protein [Planctomycetota bacterium]